MKRSFLLPLLCGAALLAGCAQLQRGGAAARFALVIGNSAYENAPPLSNPAHDAADMCAELKRLGFRTTCLVDLHDRAEFDARVKDYTDQLGPGSVGVFYYSGHGVQVGGANYLIPTQVVPKAAGDDPQRLLYPLGALFGRLEQRPTYFQLVILDACRTEMFKRGAVGGRGVAAAPAAKPSLVRAIEATGRAGTGLAPITNAPRASLVLFATGSGKAAFDGDGRNGPLTKHVLKHIGTKEQFVQTFVGQVIKGVETETLGTYYERQTPYVYGSFGDKFCFAGCPFGIDQPPQL